MVMLKQHSTELNIEDNRCPKYRRQLHQWFTQPGVSSSTQIPAGNLTPLMAFEWSQFGLTNGKMNASIRGKPGYKQMKFTL